MKRQPSALNVVSLLSTRTPKIELEIINFQIFYYLPLHVFPALPPGKKRTVSHKERSLRNGSRTWEGENSTNSFLIYAILAPNKEVG